jgi:hypothetical protein
MLFAILPTEVTHTPGEHVRTSLFHYSEECHMRRFVTILALPALALGMVGAAQAQIPPTPTDLTAQFSKMDPPGIVLKWQMAPIMPPVYPTAFKVYRGVDDSTSLAPLGVTTMMKFEDHQIQPGHTYFYAVSTVWKVSDAVTAESEKSTIAWWAVQPPPPMAHGTISGSVVDSLTGAPVPYARLSFFHPAQPEMWVPQAVADSLGTYSATLDTGTYYILCRPPVWMEMSMSILPPYLPEWYTDARNPWDATPVAVAEGSHTTADFDLVRFSLPPLAHVTGSVMDSSGNPLKNAWVFLQHTLLEIQDASFDDPNVVGVGDVVAVDGMGCVRGVAWKGRTDSLGHFDALVLSGRSYYALAGKPGFAPQFYDHVADPAGATAIAVDGDVAKIDFNLSPLTIPQTYSINGLVQDSAGARIPSRIVAFPIAPLANVLKTRFTFTDSLGEYTLPSVLPGRYHVLAIPFGRYAPSFYKAGEFGVFRWKDADTVVVSNGNVAGIDIGVVPITGPGIARLIGFVRRNGTALPGARLIAQSQAGSAVGFGLSDGAGAYTIDNLPQGELTVTVDATGYTAVDQALSISSPAGVVNQDFSLSVTSVQTRAGSASPQAFALLQNYPNPFNPSTVVSFRLPATSTVRLTVYNLLGQEVATLVNGSFGAGQHQVEWTGRNATGSAMASGVYFYRLEAKSSTGESFSSLRKMMLVK